MRPAWFGPIGAAVGAALALLVATVLGVPRGHGHSCPSGALPTACSYPPDHLRWAVEWMIGGAIIGVVLALIVAVFLAED